MSIDQEQEFKAHWLTTARQPVNTRDKNALVKWWTRQGWYCYTYLKYKRRGKKFWDIKIEK